MKTFFRDVGTQSSGGPIYRTIKKRLRGGAEHRWSLWDEPLRTFNVSLTNRDADRIKELIDFTYDTQGSLLAFRARDWSDYTLEDEIIGIGDGSEYLFRFNKVYGDDNHQRRILKPVPGTVVIPNLGLYHVDHENGVVVFKDPPPNGDFISVTCEFDVPVRFAEDATEIIMLYYKLGGSRSIGLTEVRTQEDINMAALDAARAAL